MENVTRIATTLLIGWGLGWLVARSVLFEPGRAMLASVADKINPALAPTRHAMALAASDDALSRSSAISEFMKIPKVSIIVRAAAAVFLLLYYLSHCAACSGFWIGLALARAGWGLGPTWGAALETGVAIMGVNAIIDSWLSANLARAGQ